MTYHKYVHTVVETPEYLIAAAKAGMTQRERDEAVAMVAAKPEAGDIIPGAGGTRKVRVAREGGGKSGGYRVITYFLGMDTPVFLITVISKGQTANLTEAQKQTVKSAVKDGKRQRRTR